MSKLCLGYFGIRPNSPAGNLAEAYGDCLQHLSADDKCSLIALLALWLKNDAEDYGICSAWSDFKISDSPDFEKCVDLLDCPPHFHISPEDGMALMAVLIAQIRAEVYKL